MIVAVTGASGHIGNCLVRELKKQGARIRVLVHNFKNDLDKMDVEFIPGNLLDPESLNLLCDGVDVVFHLAAHISVDNRYSNQLFATNVTGTINLIKAAQSGRVKKFIHFSSVEAFQIKSPDLKLDENRSLIETKTSIYGFTKAESEREVLKAVKEGLNAVILSPTAVIGPYDYRGSLLGQALIKMYQNRMPFLIPGGYNWVDVHDVVTASIKAMESGKNGEKYIISGNFCTLKEMASLISKISGCKVPALVPVSLARLACPFFQLYSSVTRKEPLYTNHSLDLLVSSPANISFEKAKKDLGYCPRPLNQTLIETFNWYKGNNYLS